MALAERKRFKKGVKLKSGRAGGEVGDEGGEEEGEGEIIVGEKFSVFLRILSIVESKTKIHS